MSPPREIVRIDGTLGTIHAGTLNNLASAPTAGIRLDAGSALPATWLRYVDLAGSGADPFIRHESLILYHDGSAEFSGAVKLLESTGLSMYDSTDTTHIGGIEPNGPGLGFDLEFGGGLPGVSFWEDQSGGGPPFDKIVTVTSSVDRFEIDADDTVINNGLTIGGTLSVPTIGAHAVSGALTAPHVANLATLSGATVDSAPSFGASASLVLTINGTSYRLPLHLA